MPALETLRLAEALKAATYGATEALEPSDDTLSIRVRTNYEHRQWADGSYIGTYEAATAYRIAGRLASDLEATLYRDGLCLYLTWGPRHYLSVKEVANRAGLAESSIRTYRTRGLVPEPDLVIGNTPGWLPETIEPWIAGLPGQGARTDLAPPPAADADHI